MTGGGGGGGVAVQEQSSLKSRRPLTTLRGDPIVGIAHSALEEKSSESEPVKSGSRPRRSVHLANLQWQFTESERIHRRPDDEWRYHCRPHADYVRRRRRQLVRRVSPANHGSLVFGRPRENVIPSRAAAAAPPSTDSELVNCLRQRNGSDSSRSRQDNKTNERMAEIEIECQRPDMLMRREDFSS